MYSSPRITLFIVAFRLKYQHCIYMRGVRVVNTQLCTYSQACVISLFTFVTVHMYTMPVRMIKRGSAILKYQQYVGFTLCDYSCLLRLLLAPL